MPQCLLMNRYYFDSAATTALDPQVLEAMLPYLQNKYGNPSSIYSYGRETRLAIENARKSVGKILNAHPAEIFLPVAVLKAATRPLPGLFVISAANASSHHLLSIMPHFTPLNI